MPQGQGKPGSGTNTTERQVIDFSQLRAKKLEEKRRKTERIFFKSLLSVYTVMGDGKKMLPIEIIDISEDGCSFQIPYNPNCPDESQWTVTTTDLPLRLYFSQDTYLEVTAKIANSRPSIENGARYTRYGCQVDKTSHTYPAFQQFVKFMKLYSEFARRDMGDISVFYL